MVLAAAMVDGLSVLREKLPDGRLTSSGFMKEKVAPSLHYQDGDQVRDDRIVAKHINKPSGTLMKLPRIISGLK